MEQFSSRFNIVVLSEENMEKFNRVISLQDKSFVSLVLPVDSYKEESHNRLNLN